MAVPVARVHLKVAHAALPALLPTPPKWKTPAKPSRADSGERWDAHKNKTKSGSAEFSASSSPRSTSVDSVRSCAGRGSSRKSSTSPPKPGRADSAERWDAHKKAANPVSSSSSGRADSAERWDAHKKAASPASSSSSSGSGTSPISRASSGERWDVHKKRCPPQAELLDDGESSSTGSNDIDMEEEEEIVWKPRGIYAGPGFAAAAPEPSMLPMPTSFLVPVA